jgi:hypothetical protein
MSQITKTLTSGSPIPSIIPTSFVTDSGTSIPSANIINVNGGNGVTVSANPNLSNNIIITLDNNEFVWSEQNASFSAAINNGYFCNNALTATLPPSASLVIGNSIIFFVDTVSQVIIQAGAGEFIQVGSIISVSGGTATSNTRGSILELVFKPSDLTWHTISSLGSWSIV